MLIKVKFPSAESTWIWWIKITQQRKERLLQALNTMAKVNMKTLNALEAVNYLKWSQKHISRGAMSSSKLGLSTVMSHLVLQYKLKITLTFLLISVIVESDMGGSGCAVTILQSTAPGVVCVTRWVNCFSNLCSGLIASKLSHLWNHNASSMCM